MGYTIKKGDIIWFRKGLYNIHSLDGDTGEVTILPVRQSGKDGKYIIDDKRNLRVELARIIEREARFYDSQESDEDPN